MSDQPSLLVIDERGTAEQCIAVLRPYWNPVVAQSIEQAIDLSSADEPLMLVLLLPRPGDPRSRDIGRWVRTDPELKDLPLVVWGDAGESVQEWLDAGADDVLDAEVVPALLLARLASWAEMERRNALLSQLNSLDPLTTLATGPRLEDYLDIEWRRSLREFYPIALIRLDIDHFSMFNDHYGYGAGDQALRRIARALEQHCNRAADMLSRYRDDQFMVLLPSAELDNAMLLAERMVSAVRQLGIAHGPLGPEAVLTASAGVASIEPARDKRCRDLLDETDELLSRAWQNGGDQVIGIAI